MNNTFHSNPNSTKTDKSISNHTKNTIMSKVTSEVKVTRSVTRDHNKNNVVRVPKLRFDVITDQFNSN